MNDEWGRHRLLHLESITRTIIIHGFYHNHPPPHAVASPSRTGPQAVFLFKRRRDARAFSRMHRHAPHGAQDAHLPYEVPKPETSHLK